MVTMGRADAAVGEDDTQRIGTALCAALMAETPVNADDRHAPIGEAVKHVPIFDAHILYNAPARVVMQPMNKYPALYADTSFAKPIFCAGIKLIRYGRVLF